MLFVATRRFTDRKWGTRHPLILRDPEVGPVRVRGFGGYTVRAVYPPQLIWELVGSNPQFSVEAVSEQLRNLIVSRLADLLGEQPRPVLDLAGRCDELGLQLQQRLAAEWANYGLELSELLIENLSLPAEVEAAIDQRAAIGLTGNLDAFRTYQEGIALEKAAENPAGASGAAQLGRARGSGGRSRRRLSMNCHCCCSAPVPARGVVCAYCGSRLDVDLHDQQRREQESREQHDREQAEREELASL